MQMSSPTPTSHGKATRDKTSSDKVAVQTWQSGHQQKNLDGVSRALRVSFSFAIKLHLCVIYLKFEP